MTTTKPAHERVLARVAVSDTPFRGTPCWIFTGCLDQDGYGRVKDGGKLRRTHRVMFEALVGPVADDLQIDHLCRVRSCCNPAHLEPVTGRVNVLRGETIAARNAQSTHCPKGHPYDSENTYIGNGGRYCRTCHRAHNAAIKAAREHLGLTHRAYIADYGASTATALAVVAE